MRSEGSLLFMTFSRMASLVSSESSLEGGGRCRGLGLRKAFQARWRVKARERGAMREMDITLRMVCMHGIRTENVAVEKKGRKQFDREELFPI